MAEVTWTNITMLEDCSGAILGRYVLPMSAGEVYTVDQSLATVLINSGKASAGGSNPYILNHGPEGVNSSAPGGAKNQGSGQIAWKK